jgi:hypothetical protein
VREGKSERLPPKSAITMKFKEIWGTHRTSALASRVFFDQSARREGHQGAGTKPNEGDRDLLQHRSTAVPYRTTLVVGKRATTSISNSPQRQVGVFPENLFCLYLAHSSNCTAKRD